MSSCRKPFVLFVFALSVLLFASLDKGVASYSAVVSVSPRENAVKVGQMFTIDITVENVSGLQGFDFCLKYPTSILNVTAVEEGSFMKSFGPTYVVKMEVDTDYQLYRGLVWVVIVICGDGFADGSGTLARITFNATSAGTGDLDLFSLFPYNSDKVKLVTCGPVAIPHSVSDGHVAVTADPNDPPPKLPADPPLDPPPDPSEASPDVNGDGTIDIIDLAMVAKAYGHLSEDPYYDSRVDFDNNGVIDITDIAAVAIKFHQAL